jgi:hypothetical protein
MQVLGRHGNEVFLVALSDTEGVVVDTQLRSVSPAMSLDGAKKKWNWTLALTDDASEEVIKAVLTERGVDLGKPFPGAAPPFKKKGEKDEKGEGDEKDEKDAKGEKPTSKKEAFAAFLKSKGKDLTDAEAEEAFELASKKVGPAAEAIVEEKAEESEDESGEDGKCPECGTKLAANGNCPDCGFEYEDDEEEPYDANNDEAGVISLKDRIVARRAGTPGTFLIMLNATHACELNLADGTIGEPEAYVQLRDRHPWTVCTASDAQVDKIAEAILKQSE